MIFVLFVLNLNLISDRRAVKLEWEIIRNHSRLKCLEPFEAWNGNHVSLEPTARIFSDIIWCFWEKWEHNLNRISSFLFCMTAQSPILLSPRQSMLITVGIVTSHISLLALDIGGWGGEWECKRVKKSVDASHWSSHQRRLWPSNSCGCFSHRCRVVNAPSWSCILILNGCSFPLPPFAKPSSHLSWCSALTIFCFLSDALCLSIDNKNKKSDFFQNKM